MGDQKSLITLPMGSLIPFYEGNHGNDDLPFVFVGKPLTQRVVTLGNIPGNVIQGPKPFHTGGKIY